MEQHRIHIGWVAGDVLIIEMQVCIGFLVDREEIVQAGDDHRRALVVEHRHQAFIDCPEIPEDLVFALILPFPMSVIDRLALTLLRAPVLQAFLLVVIADSFLHAGRDQIINPDLRDTMARAFIKPDTL